MGIQLNDISDTRHLLLTHPDGSLELFLLNLKLKTQMSFSGNCYLAEFDETWALEKLLSSELLGPLQWDRDPEGFHPSKPFRRLNEEKLDRIACDELPFPTPRLPIAAGGEYFINKIPAKSDFVINY